MKALLQSAIVSLCSFGETLSLWRHSVVLETFWHIREILLSLKNYEGIVIIPYAVLG